MRRVCPANVINKNHALPTAMLTKEVRAAFFVWKGLGKTKLNGGNRYQPRPFDCGIRGRRCDGIRFGKIGTFGIVKGIVGNLFLETVHNAKSYDVGWLVQSNKEDSEVKDQSHGGPLAGYNLYNVIDSCHSVKISLDYAGTTFHVGLVPRRSPNPATLANHGFIL